MNLNQMLHIPLRAIALELQASEAPGYHKHLLQLFKLNSSITV